MSTSPTLNTEDHEDEIMTLEEIERIMMAEDEASGEAVLLEEAEQVTPLPPVPSRSTATIRSLSAMSSLRVAPLRANRVMNLSRPSNLESYMVQLVGEVQETECNHCKDGKGVWTQCVTVDGYLNGSCGNCHYNNEGARCSFRPKATSASVAQAIRNAAEYDHISLGSDRTSSLEPLEPKKKIRRIAPTLVSTVLAKDPEPDLPAVKLKRKRPETFDIRHPRRSRAERMRLIAGHHRALSKLYDEEADRLDEDFDIE